MSLEVSLASFNPAIHLYQKIPVAIYTGSQEKLGADKVIKDAKKEKGFDTTVKEDPSDVGTGQFVLDEFLSSYYVVGGIEYTFKGGDPSVKQKLKLLRREWPSRINNINPETVAAQPTPAAPPATPPAPAPVEPPPPPEPPKEPVLDLDLSYFKNRDRLGSWYEFKPRFKWTADDKTLVTETPKIKVKFVGPLEKEYDANVTLENQGDSWDSYNSTFEIPKATFKDKEGAYTIKVSLTYKEQKVEKETKFKWNPWKTGDIIDQGAVTASESKKVFVWDVKYGPDYGKFVGAYTLNGDAQKNNSSPPKNGKEEGEKLEDVLKKTEEANSAELMKG